MNVPIVEIKNLSYAYEDKIALNDINLDIHEGAFLGLIGPNGGGKTTLIKLLLGLITPQQGSIPGLVKTLSNLKTPIKSALSHKSQTPLIAGSLQR